MHSVNKYLLGAHKVSGTISFLLPSEDTMVTKKDSLCSDGTYILEVVDRKWSHNMHKFQ
jgi:hypothetical protein